MVPSREYGLRATLGEALCRCTGMSIVDKDGEAIDGRSFHPFLMDETNLLAAVSYVEMNPVAAGLCKLLWDQRFSSAGARLEERDDTLFREQPMLERVGNRRDHLSG